MLQKVRGNNHPFGGVSAVLAGDHYQMEPIGMMPLYRSMLFRVHFQSLSLRELYRLQHDHIMRIPIMTDEGMLYVMEYVRPPDPR